MCWLHESEIRKLGIGTRVFLPPHGVAQLLGIEEHAFGEHSQTFYVLGLARGDKLLIPSENLSTAGLRELVSPSTAHRLLAQATTAPATPSPSYWRERAATHAEGLRTGEAEKYTEILQQLLHRSRTEKLSATDQHSLQVARGYFVAEISAALDQPAEAIEAALMGEVVNLAQESQ